MLRNEPRVSRRNFTRLLALSGSVFLPEPPLAWPAPLQRTSERPDEEFWLSVREQFLMPPELAPKEREDALGFQKTFSELNQAIDGSAPPSASELKSFVNQVTEEIKQCI